MGWGVAIMSLTPSGVFDLFEAMKLPVHWLEIHMHTTTSIFFSLTSEIYEDSQQLVY